MPDCTKLSTPASTHHHMCLQTGSLLFANAKARVGCKSKPHALKIGSVLELLCSGPHQLQRNLGTGSCFHKGPLRKQILCLAVQHDPFTSLLHASMTLPKATAEWSTDVATNRPSTRRRNLIPKTAPAQQGLLKRR